MNFIRKCIALILLILSIISSIGLLLASYIQYFSPIHFSPPALLGLAFPIFVVTTIILLLLLLPIYARYALVPFVSLLLAIPAFLQYSPINIRHDNIDTNRERFTLLSYNVYYFVDSKNEPGFDQAQHNRTLQYIIDTNADVVALQEGHGYWGAVKGQKRTQEQVDKIAQLYPYHICQNRSRIFSKYPIRLISDTIYTPSANTSIYQLDINGRTVTLINNHLESIGLTRDDKQLYSDIITSPDSIGEKLGGIKVFAKKFMNAFQLRALQSQYVDSMARTMGGNIIMCGDINDTPNSYAYHTLQKGRRDAFCELGLGPGFTYRADRMWVRIDHIIYQGTITATDIEKGQYLYSDHYPLLVTFEWND